MGQSKKSEIRMKSHWRLVALTVLLSTVMAGIATARSPHHRYKPRHAWMGAAPAGAFAPARMIEARPGVFVSSYDCVIDEGYGRYRLCSQGLK
jgi:hypothetical protein